MSCKQVVMSLLEAQEAIDQWGRYLTGTGRVADTTVCYLLFWAEERRNKTRQWLLALFLTSVSTLILQATASMTLPNLYSGAMCQKNRTCGVNIARFLPKCESFMQPKQQRRML